MGDHDRKARIHEYKETPPSAGVYRVQNTIGGRSLVGSSANLPGILNRHRFELQAGSHRNQELQRDWNDLGPDAFKFEVLDVLTPRKEADYDPAEDLAVLLELWLVRITASGESMYGPTGQRVKLPHQ